MNESTCSKCGGNLNFKKEKVAETERKGILAFSVPCKDCGLLHCINKEEGYIPNKIDGKTLLFLTSSNEIVEKAA